MKKYLKLIIMVAVFVVCLMCTVSASANTIYDSYGFDYTDSINDYNCQHQLGERVYVHRDGDKGCIVYQTCALCDSIIYSEVEHDYRMDLVPASKESYGFCQFLCNDCGKNDYSRLEEYNRFGKITLSKIYYNYDGKVKQPKVVAYDDEGNVISPSFYDVTYSDNLNPGICTVTVNFKDRYEGTATDSFYIRPKATKLSKVSYKSAGKINVSWKKSKIASGYIIQYGTKKSFKDKKYYCTAIADKKSTSKTISNLADVKYYVRVCPYISKDGKKILGEWSEVKQVTVKKGASLKSMINATKTDMSSRKTILKMTKNGVDIKKYKTTYDRFVAIYTWHAKHALEFANCMECNIHFNDCVYELGFKNRKYDLPIFLAAGNFKNRNGSVVMHKWSVFNLSGVSYIFDPRLQGYANYKNKDYFGIKENSKLSKSEYLLDGYMFAWYDSDNMSELK